VEREPKGLEKDKWMKIVEETKAVEPRRETQTDIL
jgi:hypothetical protein